MPFYFKDASYVPKGGYQYVQPESGQRFAENYWVNLVAKVRAHRVANNYPLGANFQQEIVDYNCNLNPEWCVRSEGPTLADKMKSFATAMVTWVKNGMPIVSPEEYQRRLSICENCPNFRGVLGSSFAARCGRCGCSTIKLSLSTEKCPLTPARW